MTAGVGGPSEVDEATRDQERGRRGSSGVVGVFRDDGLEGRYLQGAASGEGGG